MEHCSSTIPVNGSWVLEMGGDTAACGQPHLAAGRKVMPLKVLKVVIESLGSCLH